MIPNMDKGFEKIDLDKKIKTNDYKDPAADRMKRRRQIKLKFNPKNLGITGVVVIVLILFSIFGIFLPATKTVISAKKTIASSKLALSELKTQNITAASDQLKVAQSDLADTTGSLHAMAYLQFIPLVNWYYNDASHLLNAGAFGVQGAQLLVDSIKPYSDVLGLKGDHSFVGGSAQDRISTAVKTMDKLTPWF